MATPEQAARALLAVVPGAREVLGSCRRCGGTVAVTVLPGTPEQIEAAPGMLRVVALDDGRAVVAHRCGGALRLVA